MLKPQNQSKITKGLVSVIIPTFNSEQYLERCLTSILNQSYPKIEIIVVDNFSKDRTGEICKEKNVKFIQYRATMTGAKNKGAENATGEYFLIIDSDMILHPLIVEECIELIKKYDAISIDEQTVGDSMWAKARNFAKIVQRGSLFFEGIRFIKSTLFFQLGGYDESLDAGEDYDLMARLLDKNCKIGYNKSLIDHHEEHLSIKSVIKKKRHYARTLIKYMEKHPELAKKQFSLRRCLFYFKQPKMYLQPHLAIVLIIMKGLEWYVTRDEIRKMKRGLT